MNGTFLDDGDVRLLHADVVDGLRSLPVGVVQTVVTSPPYWGLRDYGAEGQLGLEASPEAYVERLVGAFREVRRVLRDDGTVWLNLGDSYANDTKWGGATAGKHAAGVHGMAVGRGKRNTGLKPKDLVGVPWRVAFALQADGWYLRSDIVWAKPNPMPESVTDRPTRSHEYVFLLAKRARYFYDADAIREADSGLGGGGFSRAYAESQPNHGAMRLERPQVQGRNARSVWEIATQPTPEAHFATFPEELARRCILAGSSERGGCSACGAPWRRVVEHTLATARVGGKNVHNADRNDKGRTQMVGAANTTIGWEASCACDAGPPVPQVVLDPFVGSGTTCLVARKHARRSIGIDLSAEYLAIAARRLGQQSLLSAGGASIAAGATPNERSET